MKKSVKIGLVQMKASPNPADNLKKAANNITAAARRGARIICLPELFLTPYFPQRQNVNAKKYAETVPGKTTRAMGALAKKLRVVLIAPLYEKTKTGKYYNAAAVFDETGKILGTYRKIHIPHDPGFYEKDYFDAGDRGYRVFKTRFAKFAALICYDQWYPEAARAVRLAGAEIIFCPTGIGDIVGYEPEGDWHDAWETQQRGHAIANSVYVAAINRVGREGRMVFFGQSFVCDPFGKVLKRGSKNREEIIIAELDLERNKFFSEGWGFLRNRRPETYRELISNKFVEKSKKLKNVPHYKDMKRALDNK